MFELHDRLVLPDSWGRAADAHQSQSRFDQQSGPDDRRQQRDAELGRVERGDFLRIRSERHSDERVGG
jgi:hypothetical protein